MIMIMINVFVAGLIGIKQNIAPAANKVDVPSTMKKRDILSRRSSSNEEGRFLQIIYIFSMS